MPLTSAIDAKKNSSTLQSALHVPSSGTSTLHLALQPALTTRTPPSQGTRLYDDFVKVNGDQNALVSAINGTAQNPKFISSLQTQYDTDAASYKSDLEAAASSASIDAGTAAWACTALDL